jgi:hypothetical protein
MTGTCKIVAVEGGEAFGTAVQNWLDTRGPTPAHLRPGAPNQTTVDKLCNFFVAGVPAIKTLPLGVDSATLSKATEQSNQPIIFADCFIEPDGFPTDCRIVGPDMAPNATAALAKLNSGKLRYEAYDSPKISKRRIVMVPPGD